MAGAGGASKPMGGQGGTGGSVTAMGGQAGTAEGCPAAAPTAGLKLRFVASEQAMLQGQNVAA